MVPASFFRVLRLMRSENTAQLSKKLELTSSDFTIWDCFQPRFFNRDFDDETKNMAFDFHAAGFEFEEATTEVAEESTEEVAE